MPKLNDLVAKIKREMNFSKEVPNFGPQNGNEKAKILFILEAPGPKAVKTGYVSLDNHDQSASNFRYQLEKSGISRSEIAIWNVIPLPINCKNYSISIALSTFY